MQKMGSISGVTDVRNMDIDLIMRMCFQEEWRCVWRYRLQKALTVPPQTLDVQHRATEFDVGPLGGSPVLSWASSCCLLL